MEMLGNSVEREKERGSLIFRGYVSLLEIVGL